MLRRVAGSSPSLDPFNIVNLHGPVHPPGPVASAVGLETDATAAASSDAVRHLVPGSSAAIQPARQKKTQPLVPGIQVFPGGVLAPAAGTPGLDDGATCHLKGDVDECCNCTYSAVDHINEQVVYPTLRQLVRTPFFRYFKACGAGLVQVNLWCDCPLWPDDSMCAMRACSVCECEPHEVPKPWLLAEGLSSGPSCSMLPPSPSPGNSPSGADLGSQPGRWASSGPAAAPGCNSALCAAEADSVVDRGLEPFVARQLQHMKGEHAHRIWSSIYSQSCLAGPLDCAEKRVFYRLVSGMHTSISAHIAMHYLQDEEAGNLYFSYLFVLRAVMKARSLLAQFEYTTGEPEADQHTSQLMADLEEAQAACPMPFDEGRLWKGGQGPALLDSMQAAFRNITRIMDCVGCEKCKLWGKLQTLGIATALKVLFSSADCDGAAPGRAELGGSLSLERNEVIALINLLERFAASLHYYKTLSAQAAASDPAASGSVARTDVVQ
ncbi:endoplasmic reticulum oxidoreductin 1 family protein [Haematococcus lacustris]|uniref:Endoplasmic reticulum oxidoreductin 1 family protein n=1 Tax=Haematococcus lacustris TaxID=44745 RepID=A0A6A0A8S2_HAELA|nr:endoplasmic reticulum oxidoreductin 1 family protein [Haematococcus lacustris]